MAPGLRRHGRVKRHDDDAIRALRGGNVGRSPGCRSRAWRGSRWRRHGSRCLCNHRRSRCWSAGALIALGNQITQRVDLGRCRNRRRGRRRDGGMVRSRRGGRVAGIAQALADQRFQRVHGLGGVEVQHQPVLVGSNRGQRKDLGPGFLLEVDHQAHHAGRKLADADAGDIGVVGADLGHQFLERRVQIQAFDIDGQARRAGHEDRLGRQRNIGFQRDTRVVGRGPDAHCHDARALRNMLATQQQHHAACLQQIAAGKTRSGETRSGKTWLGRARKSRERSCFAHAVNASSTVQPAGVPALSVTCRCTSSIASI